MKKIFLFAAVNVLLSSTYAQMNYIEEITVHASEHGAEFANMFYSSHEILPKIFGGHLMGTSLVTYEFADGDHVVRGHGGLGYSNKAHTFGFGVKAGLKTYVNSFSRFTDDVHLSTGFWLYADYRRVTFTTIFLDLRAYLVEGAYLLNKEKSEVQISGIITNHGPNWGFGIKCYHQKSGIYGFLCVTGKAYSLDQNAKGETEVHFNNPTTLPGLLGTLGFERKHKSKV